MDIANFSFSITFPWFDQRLYGLGLQLLRDAVYYFCLFSFMLLHHGNPLSSKFSFHLKTSLSWLVLLASPFPVAPPSIEIKKVYKTQEGLISHFISSKSVYWAPAVCTAQYFCIRITLAGFLSACSCSALFLFWDFVWLFSPPLMSNMQNFVVRKA